MSVIRVVFEGMMLLFVNNGRKFCDVGILKNAAGHSPRLIVNKISQGDPEEIARLGPDDFKAKLWLDVVKTPLSLLKIQLASDGSGSPFNRDRPNTIDFRWALDFEGPEMYQPDGRIDVDLSGFSSVLRINDGTFSTKQISSNTLKTTCGPPPGANETSVGKVATKLRAEIVLAGAETAKLWNGADAGQPTATFTHQEGIDYAIHVGNTRGPYVSCSNALSEPADAENYYSVVAANIAPGRKKHFGAPSKSDPDARCLTGWMSQTELP